MEAAGIAAICLSLLGLTVLFYPRLRIRWICWHMDREFQRFRQEREHDAVTLECCPGGLTLRAGLGRVLGEAGLTWGVRGSGDELESFHVLREGEPIDTASANDKTAILAMFRHWGGPNIERFVA